jgi:peroxiredoxin
VVRPVQALVPVDGRDAEEVRRRRLTVVAINVDKKREDAAKFLAATPGAFTIVYDPAGAVASSYDVKGMPTSYLVDRAGRIVAVDNGFRDDAKAAWEARIKSALDTK